MHEIRLLNRKNIDNINIKKCVLSFKLCIGVDTCHGLGQVASIFHACSNALLITIYSNILLYKINYRLITY